MLQVPELYLWVRSGALACVHEWDRTEHESAKTGKKLLVHRLRITEVGEGEFDADIITKAFGEVPGLRKDRNETPYRTAGAGQHGNLLWLPEDVL